MPADGGFRGCLERRGIRLPEDEREPGNEERMRTAVEACASRLVAGEAVRIPVVEGSAFQACLASRGVTLPPVGEWLRILPGDDPVMDAALASC
ncbi:hypothetical protein [Actinomadura sediminis]|uniref:Uncharacterized protein n=1 Tax=Actinomadura sediminis TaxID=1038904 RepID=A0ABW3EXP5_9ACTN